MKFVINYAQLFLKRASTVFDPANFRMVQKNVNELIKVKQYNKAIALLDSIEPTLTEAPKVWVQQKRQELNLMEQLLASEHLVKPRP